MPRTLRGTLRGSVLLCFILATAFGLFAATPNAGQTGPLASAAAVPQAAPIKVQGATVGLTVTHFSIPFGTNGVNLITRGKGAVQGICAPWRVHYAGRSVQKGSPGHSWVCLICHLPSSANL